jgi:hypothetical protein
MMNEAPATVVQVPLVGLSVLIDGKPDAPPGRTGGCWSFVEVLWFLFLLLLLLLLPRSSAALDGDDLILVVVVDDDCCCRSSCSKWWVSSSQVTIS